MKNLLKDKQAPQGADYTVIVYNSTVGSVGVKEAEPIANIILTYADGHVVKNYTATTMTWDLIEGKTSEDSTNTTLVKAELNEGVTSIGDSAFYNCKSLTSVTIPNSVTSIGESAFGNCSSLTEVVIPNSVTSIGDGAFWGCTSLTGITIPYLVTSLGEGTFMSCM